MQLSAGHTVIHPHHGPATVTRVVERTFGGTTRRYVDLLVRGTELTVSVPLDSAEEVGLRALSGHDGLAELFDVLRGPTGPEENGWSRRFKANQEKLRVGELRITAEVVRDLTRRLAEKGLSTGEKDLLRQARQPIVGELALALDLDDDAAEDLVDSAVLARIPRSAAAADVVVAEHAPELLAAR